MGARCSKHSGVPTEEQNAPKKQSTIAKKLQEAGVEVLLTWDLAKPALYCQANDKAAAVSALTCSCWGHAKL